MGSETRAFRVAEAGLGEAQREQFLCSKALELAAHERLSANLCSGHLEGEKAG